MENIWNDGRRGKIDQENNIADSFQEKEKKNEKQFHISHLKQTIWNENKKTMAKQMNARSIYKK